ncbi:hypothetical protein [Desulfosporosinus sp. FKA]|uniref:hypothetical protein n=1 Tax=Desulfosporosinus sp. FKA TaxID=1969834 RepID=UPI000B4A232B|nr:hypothetical protein [Desulfosporosinus sp. FKA]
MKRIKIGIALISMFGLLLGTASIANAKTVSPAHQLKVSQTAKSTHHKAKQAKTVHKTVKLKASSKQASKHVTKKA